MSEREPSGPALRYGIDAIYVPIVLGAATVVLVVLGIVGSNVWLVVIGLFFLAQTAMYLYTTLIGKHQVWSGLLDRLGLQGPEHVLDLGCGRGAVLVAAARRLDSGSATGIDLWRSVDQSGNDQTRTHMNAEAASVGDRVTLDTGDLRSLPYPDASFDVVVSSLAIHNISGIQERLRAIDEAARVLRPGGRLCIADIRSVGKYAQRLRELGMVEVNVRRIGPNGWFGGPWEAMTSVTAARPK
ncbi:class I SAM-dependent methyltransferase [Gordonia sp. i37]|uniref:class I SAM-dependent methyltransferase n=1 Tax=Gordonia sp. i37 TaxID=1961707 RepID=UPI0009ADEF27|nr:class I SAM-dependent methyltransferase [Gordonia sp. i37]OPX09378.1 hypothetical protein B1964_25340 [Gordonia sp. i37]